MGRSSLPKAHNEDDQKERKGKRGKAAAIGVGGSRGLRRDAVSGGESPEALYDLLRSKVQKKTFMSKIPIPTESLDCGITMDDKCETRLYVGNLDKRITESNVIKMFTPFGKIISEEFLWHTRGPKRGEPRGYVFIQYSTKE
ncbi:hypothetical protein J5N97_021805 [Dioscorea zingiberensis]|uniref:RRM domain-containing protein n=1 Tax=Dioscorea zingiberensis TaxID=325984 RepID=A0A9D5HAE2_9LILI|nr:hypothetical protein J5N97_021805 [Dioscorea zingiberensis]